MMRKQIAMTLAGTLFTVEVVSLVEHRERVFPDNFHTPDEQTDRIIPSVNAPFAASGTNTYAAFSNDTTGMQVASIRIDSATKVDRLKEREFLRPLVPNMSEKMPRMNQV